MLKVEPRFKLDQGCKGPFQVNEVTPTNATIQRMDDPNAEPLVVSLQRLLLHNDSFSSGTQLWQVIASLEGTIKSEDLHRVGIIHQLRHRNNVAGNGQEPTRTHRGKEVRKPAHYCLAVEGPICHGEGRCKGVDHEIKR